MGEVEETMQTLLFPNASLRAPAALFLRPLGFGKAGSTESLLNLTEITEVYVHYGSQRGTFQSSISSIRSEGNRKGRSRRNPSTDSDGADTLKDPSTSNVDNPKSASQDEIIALFKRIQTSISKGGPTSSRRTSAKSQKLRRTGQAITKFPKQEQVRVPRLDEYAQLPERSDNLNETTDDTVCYSDAKDTRPISNFVKRSPIPPPSLGQETKKGVDEEQLQSTTREKEEEKQWQLSTTERIPDLQNLDELKLPDLKEIAKRKGVKGYSKMKKGDLLELLKGLSVR